MENQNRQLINSLRKRFVDDYKLPIDLFYDDELFYYFLSLYEKDFKSRTSWDLLVDTIDEKFNGNPQLFLNEYYRVREEMISSILNNEHFKEFNDSKNDLSKYNLPEESRQYSTKNIYNCENDGKVFLSIDLNKANYSALLFHNPQILGLNERIPYEDWVRKFTDLSYIINSKYIRQVVFGKLNPARQIKVEKYMIWKALKDFKEFFDMNRINYNIVSFSTDEVVFEIENNSETIELIWEYVVKTIELTKNFIPIKGTIFKLNLKRFKTFNESFLNVFEKKFIKGKNGVELKGVPSYFYAQVYKLLTNGVICDFDKMFWSNDQPAIFLHKLELS